MKEFPILSHSLELWLLTAGCQGVGGIQYAWGDQPLVGASSSYGANLVMARCARSDPGLTWCAPCFAYTRKVLGSSALLILYKIDKKWDNYLKSTRLTISTPDDIWVIQYIMLIPIPHTHLKEFSQFSPRSGFFTRLRVGLDFCWYYRSDPGVTLLKIVLGWVKILLGV